MSSRTKLHGGSLADAGQMRSWWGQKNFASLAPRQIRLRRGLKANTFNSLNYPSLHNSHSYTIATWYKSLFPVVTLYGFSFCTSDIRLDLSVFQDCFFSIRVLFYTLHPAVCESEDWKWKNVWWCNSLDFRLNKRIDLNCSKGIGAITRICLISWLNPR